MKTIQELITEQRVHIQRKYDKILGKDRMNYEQFCDSIDELIHPDTMDFKDGQPVCKTRDSNKALAAYMHETIGTPYYDIYLSIKYNTTI